MSGALIACVGGVFASRFELVAPLADAGLGESWSAVDLSANRRPALLKLFPARSPSESWSVVVARLQGLGNPRLPKVIDGAELPDGRRWLAFEPVKGRSLANWLDGHREAGTAPGLGVVQRLFDAVSNALQVGHGARQKPVIHRGLSPASVLIEASPGGHIVTLLDHELAAFVETEATWPYLAPEQHGARAQESAASDVFSLAVLLTELLSMRATPRADSPETWWQFAQRAPREVKTALGALRSDVPKELWDVLGEALQLDAKKRPRDAQTFASAVRQQTPSAWKRLPMTEREPPVLTRARVSVVAPRAEKRSADVPDGWMTAERRSDTPRAEERTQAPTRVDARGAERSLIGIAPASIATPVSAPAPQPAFAPSKPLDDVGSQTLVDDDDLAGSTFEHFDSASTQGYEDDAPKTASQSVKPAATLDYDDSEVTSSLVGGGGLLRSAAAQMFVGRSPIQASPPQAPGTQTLPLEAFADEPASVEEAPASRQHTQNVGTVAPQRGNRPGSDTLDLEDSIAFRSSVDVGPATLPLGQAAHTMAPIAPMPKTIPIGYAESELMAVRTLPLEPEALGGAHVAPPRAFGADPRAGAPSQVAQTLVDTSSGLHRQAGTQSSRPSVDPRAPVGDARPSGLMGVPPAVWVAISIAVLLVIAAVLVVTLR